MQKKWTSFLITVALLFGMFFFVTIKLGEGYSPKSQSSPFDSSAFFSSLQLITGQLFI
ncbi:MAG: hypothetical protein LBG59_05390 [Candidatus Peribacteria bacterium]|jgi:hypothetical protein|nr:hypothetical protein [Candidatus Peribacteria bacterium]